MHDLVKLTVTKDSFIFAVNQAYEARVQLDGSFHSHLKYEPFLAKSWVLPHAPSLNTFKQSLLEIMEHHFKILPNYQKNELVNIENISWFSHSVAVLIADVEFLVKAYTGDHLPVILSSQIPKANNSKNIALAIKKCLDFKNMDVNGEKYSLFPLLNQENENVDEAYSNEIWSLIFYFLKKVFATYAQQIQLFIVWKYQKHETTIEVVDWNVRPPCGEAYRKQFKHLFERFDSFSNKKGANAGNRNDKHSFRKENKERKEYKDKEHDKQPHQDRVRSEEQVPDAQVTENNNHKIREDRDYKFRNKSEHKNKFQRTDRENRREQEQVEVLEKALLEASQAVEKMQKNKNIKEIALSPQNSFVRREQHVVIAEGGFETESRGEDENRYVCVKRK